MSEVPENNSPHQPVIITGMHRSGTSLTASILEKAGVHLGDDLLGPTRGNPKGHFEDLNFLAFHQDVLAAQGLSREGWTTQKTVSVPQQFWARARQLCDRSNALPLPQLWGWKEPRTTLFLDFWRERLPSAKFVFVYRSPWEVVDSLFVRGDPTFQRHPNFAIAVWTAYNDAVLQFCQRYPEVSFLFHCQALRTQEAEFVQAVAKKFAIPLTVPPTSSFSERVMHTQVSDTHRPVLLAHYFPQTFEVYRTLELKADLPSRTSMDAVSEAAAQPSYQDWICQDWLASSHTIGILQDKDAELQKLQAKLGQQDAELAARTAELEQARLELARLSQAEHDLRTAQAALLQAQQTILAMESSTFWKLRDVWLSIRPHSKTEG